ncbi:MAG: hypothetical protein NWQ22_07720, partial [Burkholderiaceae bacterium]|nr:hypothetical protein [Burkholderiaceae bacterium]
MNALDPVYTVGYQSMSSVDEAIIEVVSLETGEQKVIHEGGYYARYVPTGHILYVQDATLFALSFDPERLEASGSQMPVLEGIES